MVDNSLSPHGGVLIEKTAFIHTPEQIEEMNSLPCIPVRDQLAHECVNIAYGFFSPLEGFMGA
ncbi:MAG: sulfate adenylyltransferase, partial [Chloroflexota bacterium]|nr:sulfate adenylyltransferase [Chloroflexota bacterium]